MESNATSLNNRILIRGWLKKKGGFLSGWKTYYFVLHGSTLSCFNGSDFLQSPPKHQEKVLSVEKSLDITHGFVVGTLSNKPVYLACHTSESLRDWIQALTIAIKSTTVVSDVAVCHDIQGSRHGSHSHSEQHSNYEDKPNLGGYSASLVSSNESRHHQDDDLSSFYASTQTISIASGHGGQQRCQQHFTDAELKKQKKKVYLFVPTTGSSVGVPEDIIKDATVLMYRMAEKYGYAIPDRGDLDDPTVEWLHGKPNYALANLAFFRGKSRNHKDGSLEQIAENLVKKWEMEASHKRNYLQWKTINHEKYHTTVNNSRIYAGEEAASLGNYNWLLADVRRELYDASQHTFNSSHMAFRSAFPRGFPWEVVEVYSPPPKVAFTWRHWAEFSGTYKGNQGDGQMIEMFGFCITTLDENNKIVKLEVYYKPEKFLEALEGKITLDELQKYSSANQDRYSDLMEGKDISEKRCLLKGRHHLGMNDGELDLTTGSVASGCPFSNDKKSVADERGGSNAPSAA